MPVLRTPLDRSAAAIGLITVVAANFLYLSGLKQILDPMMSMDPFYIRLAQQPLSSILAGNAAWGPLYAVWLKPLVATFGDPVAVYTANIYALSLGVSLAIYFHLLLLTRRAVLATVAALFFVVSDLNVPLASKASSFALMILLAGLTVSEWASSRGRRLSVAAGTALLASYARPEVYPAAWCLGAVALWFAYREPGPGARRALLWPITAVICLLLLAFFFGAPTYGSGRLFIAFREHFAWNWSRWHGPGETFLTIWQQAFGDAHSIVRAVLNNPGAAARHLFDNLRGTADFMVAAALNHYPVLAPADQKALVRIEDVLVSGIALGFLLYVVFDSGSRRRMCLRYGNAILSYGAFATFSLGSAAVIFPVAHYLTIPAGLLIAATTLAVAEIVPADSSYSWRWRIGAAVLCLIAIPKPFVLPSAYEVAGSRFKGQIAVRRPVLDTIELVRSLRLPLPVHVITTTDGVGEMLGAGFDEVKVWERGERPLQEFMRDNDVGVIINLEGGRESFTVADPYWELIHTEPQRAGFVRVPVPNHETVQVYVRTDLMPVPLPSEGGG